MPADTAGIRCIADQSTPAAAAVFMTSFHKKRSLVAIWLMPRRVFKALATEERRVWGFPLLVIALALLIKTLASGWVKQMELIIPALPPEFQYYLPEEQERLMRALELTKGPLFVYIFPSFGSLLGMFLQWLILSGAMRTALRTLRDKTPGVIIRNIIAWGSLPFALRYLIQAAYIFLAGRQITQTGLAVLAQPGDPLMLSFWSGLDIYLIWQVFLILLGCKYTARIPLWKSIPSLFVSIFIVLVLSAIVSMGMDTLGGMLTG
jgi:hypothetical protein